MGARLSFDERILAKLCHVKLRRHQMHDYQNEAYAFLRANPFSALFIDMGMGNPDIPAPDHIVNKVIEAAQNPRNHRYSASRGIPNLRLAICNWYKRRFNVDLDPETEAIVMQLKKKPR